MLDEIDAKVDMQKLEETLMEEGIEKFADPQKALLKLIAEKRGGVEVSRRQETGDRRQETDKKPVGIEF